MCYLSATWWPNQTVDFESRAKLKAMYQGYITGKIICNSLCQKYWQRQPLITSSSLLLNQSPKMTIMIDLKLSQAKGCTGSKNQVPLIINNYQCQLGRHFRWLVSFLYLFPCSRLVDLPQLYNKIINNLFTGLLGCKLITDLQTVYCLQAAPSGNKLSSGP